MKITQPPGVNSGVTTPTSRVRFGVGVINFWNEPSPSVRQLQSTRRKAENVMEGSSGHLRTDILQSLWMPVAEKVGRNLTIVTMGSFKGAVDGI